MTQALPAPTVSSAVAMAPETPSLLFVDDEPAILTALRVVFRRGYDVAVTTNGFEAIEWIKTRKFHVVVCDQCMPAITGVEVLCQARELSPGTVRMLLTGYSDTDAIVGAINEVEVHRFLQKPWDNQRLRLAVDEAIALARNFVDEPVNQTVDPAEQVSAPPPTVVGSLASAEREVVLVVDPVSDLCKQTRAEMGGKVEVEHATSINDVFRVLGSKRVGIMVCSFDTQSEADRTFLQMLKQQHPFILTIAVCDSTDASRLIELINHTKIFRYIRKPVNVKVLAHYLHSAVNLLRETRVNRKLLLRQTPDRMSSSLAESAAAASFSRHFAAVHKNLWARFSTWFRQD